MSRWDTENIAEKARTELDELESLRQECLADIQRKNSLAWKVGGVFAALTIVAYLAAGHPLALILGVIITAIAFAVARSSTAHDTYRQQFKSRVLADLVHAVEPDLDYQYGGQISKAEFEASGFCSGRPDRYKSEDLFDGKVGDTHLRFAEIHAEERRTRTDSKGNTTTYYVDIFCGILVIADFHKHFKTTVTVLPDVAEKFGWFGKKLQKLGGGLQKMENAEFERAFVVRGSDAVETRYLITPAMQEHLLAMREKFGDGIGFRFQNQGVWAAIPNNKDWFEIDVRTPAHDREQLKNLMFQVWSCTAIVEMLDLNTRIWTKD